MVAVAADIPSVVAPEWVWLVVPEWATGMAAIGAIISIIMITTSSLLVTSASHGGGVGAGTGATRTTAIIPTAMVILMATVTALASMAMGSTAMPATPEWRSYSADLPVLVITMAPSTGFWGHKRAAQSGRTRRTTAREVEPGEPGDPKVCRNHLHRG